MGDLLYPQGSSRYFFFHGNHGDVPIPETITVEAKIVAFTAQGQMYAYLPISYSETILIDKVFSAKISRITPHSTVLRMVSMKAMAKPSALFLQAI
jgi:hypothetical protein